VKLYKSGVPFVPRNLHPNRFIVHRCIILQMQKEGRCVKQQANRLLSYTKKFAQNKIYHTSILHFVVLA